MVTITFSLIIWQCTYEPNETYFNPINPPEPIEVFIDVESPDFSDPYYLDFPTTFSFSVDRTGKPLLEHSVIIDDSNVLPSSLQNGKITFRIDPLSINVGAHNVKLSLTFKSNSGSLADQLGAEVYQAANEFKLIVDNQPPTLAQLVTSKIENGYLTLRWKINTNRPYRLRMSNGYNSSDFISKPNEELIYVDSGFVGKPTAYSLTAINAFGNFYIGGTNSPLNNTKFEVQSSLGQVTKLVWSSLFFPANISVVGPHGSKTISISTGLLDLDSLFLGDELEYTIIVSRNKFPNQKFDSVFVVRDKKNIPDFNDLRVVTAFKLFLSHSGELYDLAVPEFTRVDSTRIIAGYGHNFNQFRISADGGYLTALSGELSLPFIINPNALTDVLAFRASIIQPNGVGSYAFATSHTASSINGLLGGSIIYNGQPKPVIYDLKKDTDASQYNAIIWKDTTNEDTPLLAPNGDYFCINSRDQLRCDVYRITIDTWNLVGHLPSDAKYFRGKSSLEVISIGTSKIKVYDISLAPNGFGDYQPVRQFTIPATPSGSRLGEVGYDETSQMLFVETIDSFNYSTFRLFDIQNFNFSGKAKANIRSVDSFTKIRHLYSGGYHFISTGYAQKIQP